MQRNKAIYFHVGLGKVASTYLQHAFFPQLKDLHYIKSRYYKNYSKHIDEATSNQILLSREFDNQLEYEVSKFSKRYPDTHIIIAFRRHDAWIASQYRRYVKNGGHRSFSQFFDIEKDEGLWKQEQVYFMPKIKIIEKYFHQKPLVLFHEDLKKDAFAFFNQISQYTNSNYDTTSVSLAKIHSSYTDKQLKFIRSVASRLFKEPNSSKSVVSESGFRHWIKRRSKMLACYATMYSSIFLPEKWIGLEPLVPPNELEKVRAFFEADWQALKKYAHKIEK